MKEVFTIGTSNIPGAVIIPHIMPEILKRDPNFILKLAVSNSADTFEKVRLGQIQVGIIGTRFPSDEVNFLPVVRGDRLVLIAGRDHLLAKKERLTLDDLKGQAFINREPGSGTRLTYEDAFRQAGLSMDAFNIIAEIASTEGVIEAVQSGAGLAVVSEIAVHQSVCCGDIVLLNLPLQMERDFYIITSKNHPLPAIARDLVNLLEDVLGQRE
jgi:DNA-binding transcriptional LysR family regulator